MKINVDLDFLSKSQLNVILRQYIDKYNISFNKNKIYLEDSIYTLYEYPKLYTDDKYRLIADIELLITTTHEMSVYVLNAINKVLIERDKRL